MPHCCKIIRSELIVVSVARRDVGARAGLAIAHGSSEARSIRAAIRNCRAYARTTTNQPVLHPTPVTGNKNTYEDEW